MMYPGEEACPMAGITMTGWTTAVTLCFCVSIQAQTKAMKWRTLFLLVRRETAK